MTKTVPLYGRKAAGRVALVDDADYELVMQHRWYVRERHEPGQCPAGPYAVTGAKRNERVAGTAMHILIMGRPWVDHIDHDTLNNQRSNLRPATPAENTYHSRPRTGTTSPYKGVHWSSRDRRWQARIKQHGRSIYLGNFTAEKNAALAYDVAARKLFGEFAVLNFPEIEVETVCEPKPRQAKPPSKPQGYLWMQAALKKRRQRESA